MLRRCYFVLLLFTAYPALFPAAFSPDRILSDPPPRQIKIAAKPSLPAFAEGRLTLEIVVAPGSVPVVHFAAAELGRYLKQALGVTVPVVSDPDPELTSLVLGDTAWSRAAGISIEEMPLDGLFIKSRGTSIYLGGIDDPECDPVKSDSDHLHHAHGTVTAVYDFLERFLDIRFYFPGEMGTLVPPLDNLAFPEMDIVDRPDLPRRHFAWPENMQFPEADLQPGDLTRYQLQLRNSAFPVPDRGGIESLAIAKRWVDKYPDILGADESGHRQNSSEHQACPRFCFASEFLLANLYQDAEAFLTGKAASSRGLEAWNPAAFQPGFFNLSLPENAQNCYCRKCQMFYQNRPESERFWAFIAAIAGQMQQNAVPGYLTLCSSGQYEHLPQISLPGNILIAVSADNPWIQNNNRPNRLKEQLAFWRKTLKRKPWLAINIHSGTLPSFLPAVTPLAVGNYISSCGPAISGAHFRTPCTGGVICLPELLYSGKMQLEYIPESRTTLAGTSSVDVRPRSPRHEQFFCRLRKTLACIVESRKCPAAGKKGSGRSLAFHLHARTNRIAAKLLQRS